ncbi:helix-turn-helix domain-containing protein [Flavobacterium foetidum]|uniref:helix-turn-helix domain-containing protein n=1 Tax=Flavobacterium foetidum TaxID=2026681 RepID=UPI00107570C3|nr:AraC family transcriptional regulator [Flavobacterium foetidum]KAF2515581.1 helix-turn-helix transcriptional regulator [Flavobacterium foetidum]
MKIIEHSFGPDLDWLPHYAEQLGGKIDGNFIIAPDNGIRYILPCGEGISAFYVDVTYNSDFHKIQKNRDTDFIGLYYNLTDGEATLTARDFMYNVSRWHYNLSVIDGLINTDYVVKSGSRTYGLAIFIKKSIIESYAKKENIVINQIEEITNPEKNTIIRFDRMSYDSYYILEELHKQKVGGPIFDFNLAGTVHLLISNYLRKLSTNKIILQTVNQTDLNNIILIQKYLIEHAEETFPSIKQMADMANMSESKFKILFRKITGSTPNVFFMENKLIKAKELLEEKQYSISQISDKFHFTNNSYFTSKFKEYYGLSPKIFIKHL